MKKAEKVTFVGDLSKELLDAKSVVLINYSGLSVKSQQELKSRLKEAKGKMVVVKNTLLKLAAEKANIAKDILSDNVLTGQTALVLAEDDPIAPIQALGKFSKEFSVPKFKVGVIEGVFQDSTTLEKISDLPGRDALLGQLLGSLMSPLYGLVGTLNSPMQQLVYTLKTKAG